MSATVIVLEDDAVLRNLLGEVLQDEGYQVITAESLPGLLAMMPQSADLLITDLFFNFEVGGLHAIEQIRAIMDPHLPAIICSAAQKQLQELQTEIDRLDARLLAKPFTIDELVSQVNMMLQRSVAAPIGYVALPGLVA